MNSLILIAVLLVLSAIGYQVGRKRALAGAGGQISGLHSLPSYYGSYVALWCALPALLVIGLLARPSSPASSTAFSFRGLPASVQALSEGQLNLLLSDIRNLAAGDITSKTPDPMVQAAAERYNDLRSTGFAAMVVVGLALGIGGLTIGWRAINPSFRARPRVEKHRALGADPRVCNRRPDNHRDRVCHCCSNPFASSIACRLPSFCSA